MDRALERAHQLLACAVDRLDPPPCRSFLHPGIPVPHDVCEATDDANGQLWVAVAAQTPHWPNPTGQPQTCPALQTMTAQVGVVRCAQGVVTDSNPIPAADAITADADRQLTDRWQLEEAIACCFAGDDNDVLIDRWDATPPQGGCVGGFWTLRFQVGGCRCQGDG